MACAVASGSASCESSYTSAFALATADALGIFHEVPLLSAGECDTLIAAAERHAKEIGGWKFYGDHEGAATRHAQVDDLPTADRRWLQIRTAEHVVPLLSKLYGLPSEARLREEYRVVKYCADSPAASVALHSDGTPLSLVCPLNEGFGGGGTYVRVLDRAICSAKGHALLFCGKWMHSGLPCHTGIRYVLTGFFQWESEGAALTRAVDRIQRSEECFSVVQRLCPNGRWLHRSVGARGHDGVFDRARCASCHAVGRSERPVHHCAAAGCCGMRSCSRCVYASALEGHSRGTPAVPRVDSEMACVTEPRITTSALLFGGFATVPAPGMHVRWAADSIPLLLEPANWGSPPIPIQIRRGESGVDALRRAGITGADEALRFNPAGLSSLLCGDGHASEPRPNVPHMRADFRYDVTVPDGMAVVGGASLLKVWRVSQGLDDGGAPWTDHARPLLVRDDVDAESFGECCIGCRSLPEAVTLLPDGEADLTVELTAPMQPGPYRCYFRVVPAGSLVGFGDRLWADFVVSE